jgi:serralysin
MTNMATVNGTNGNDSITPYNGKGVTNGSDTIFGYGGHDTLFGGGGGDKLYGMDGDDKLDGEGGADILFGGANDDVLVGGAGADHLDGGGGVDLADYWSSTEGVNINLLSGKGKGGDAEGDTLADIENVGGSNHADILWGNDDANKLYGQDGADVLKGFGGADALFGHAGDDTLNGMDGADSIMGFSGNDTIIGGAGRDVMWGNSDADTFVWSSTAEAPFVYDPAWNELNYGVDPNSIDQIPDFNHAEGDLLDLGAIDANVSAAGNQAFSFIGTAAFSGTPGEIRYYQEPLCIYATFLQINTDSDIEAEAMIKLEGILAPEASWFVL